MVYIYGAVVSGVLRRPASRKRAQRSFFLTKDRGTDGWTSFPLIRFEDAVLYVEAPGA